MPPYDMSGTAQPTEHIIIPVKECPICRERRAESNVASTYIIYAQITEEICPECRKRLYRILYPERPSVND